jgi:hypothetical protein
VRLFDNLKGKSPSWDAENVQTKMGAILNPASFRLIFNEYIAAIKFFGLKSKRSISYSPFMLFVSFVVKKDNRL